LARRRGGQYLYTHYPDGEVDGIRVSLSREVNRLRGAANDAMSERAERSAKQEYGGDQSLSNKQMLIGSLVSMVMGCVVGGLIFLL